MAYNFYKTINLKPNKQSLFEALKVFIYKIINLKIIYVKKIIQYSCNNIDFFLC